MAYIPIWKDYPVTLGTGSSYDFEIRLDDSSGAVIYSGSTPAGRTSGPEPRPSSPA